MDFGHHKWNRAELEFGHWLKGNTVTSSPDRTNILKAAYLVFRVKESERLKEFCNKAFVLFRENEIRQFDEAPLFSRVSLSIKEAHVEEESDFLNFFRGGEPEKLKRKTKEKNEIILQGILAGVQPIFDDLYEYEFPKVVRLVTRNSGSLDGAKDIFQDGLIILMEKVYRKELDLTCSVGTYLYSICRNLWREQLRKDQKNISFYDPHAHLEADIACMEEETDPEVLEAVNKAIATLGDPCRQLLESFYYENQSWDDIASTLGYSSAASARNQKYKCLERIRKTVGVDVE